MRTKFPILVAAIVAIAATGYLLYSRARANSERTAQSLGLGLRTPTPAPTPKAGTMALTDVNDLVKPPAPSVQTDANGLQKADLVVGTGDEAVAGSVIAVHYTGRLTNGTVFDSSVARGEPYSFTLGAKQVIPGWDLGLVGMRVGGKRTLVIPPALAYGEQGAGDVIAPNATLMFEVELLSVSTR